jgi:hypothetical protein
MRVAIHATFVFIEPLFLALDARPLSNSYCNRLSYPIIFSTTEEKTPTMEKNEMPIAGTELPCRHWGQLTPMKIGKPLTN